MSEPVFGTVQCLSPAGLHYMRYVQWGDPHNPRVLICVHGLARTGRDFDHLARAMQGHYRVICPDVVGRGRSDWLRDPAHYLVRQYVADMVTLIARLEVEHVSWVGTSMGGLVGIGLAGLPQSPIDRLVLNDVGPRLELSALARIGAYVGQPVRFDSLEQATEYMRSIGAGFAMRNDLEWREISASVLRPDGNGFVLHYDPRISAPMRSLTPELIVAGEQMLWNLYDAIRCPTLLLHGAESDLLTAASATEMGARGPRARIVRFAGVGHVPMLFDPAQIEPVRTFLLEDW